MSENCCKLMDEFIADKRVPIQYYPIFREYALPLVNSKHVIQEIFYCPWCGTKLPGSTRDEFFNILVNEYKIEPDFEIKKDPKIPEEFKSDQWWKKRNL